jgi:hypothetical protein
VNDTSPGGGGPPRARPAKLAGCAPPTANLVGCVASVEICLPGEVEIFSRLYGL